MSCGDMWKRLLARSLGRGLGVRTGWPAAFCGAVLLVVALGAGFAQGGPAPAANGVAGGLRRARLHAVVSSRMFTAVNRNDALAAIKACFELVGKERGFDLDSKVDIVAGPTEMRLRLEAGAVDILILDFIDYLQLENTGLIVPDLVGSRSSGGGPRYSYVLLVGQSPAAETLADLRGKNMHYFSRSESNTGLAWLDVTLAKDKLGRASSFFARSTQASKPQACVLPLFFGAADACVVDEINMDLLKEMNPQLAKLRILARSAPLIDSVIATPVQQFPYRQELMDAILGLHSSTRGRQLLTVFKTGRLVRIAPGDLDSARALWTEYRKLAGAFPASKPEGMAITSVGTPPVPLNRPPAAGKD